MGSRRSLAGAWALLAVPLLTVVAGLVFAEEEKPASREKAARAGERPRVRVACIGDSITYGAGIKDRETNCYPSVLAGLLGADSDVRNFGVNGATLLKKGDRPYWKLDAFEEATAFEPHVVVIQLGTNDTKPRNWKHRDEFAGDLRVLVDRFRSLPTRPAIWLCEPVPVYRDRWGINEATLTTAVIPLIHAVASEKRLGTIGLHGALSGVPDFFPDGVHPDARGADRLARAVHASLRVDGGGASRPAPGGGTRPSFVVVIADDMGWDDCGAYGHPRVRTPNVDRLAREGLVFERAFLTTSSCSPSRSSIVTGRYPHSTGAAELHQPLPGRQLTFSEVLRGGGYYTASAGKWHLGNDALVKFDRVYRKGGPGGSDEWLRALRERPRDRPFFLWLAAVDPHRPYGKDTVPRPHGPADARVPPFLPDVAATRSDLALYYDEISRLDGRLGEVLDELDRQGVARDTFVLFLSDNGRPFPRCKTTLYDAGIRTPFIVRWPARVKPGRRTKSLVSSVDIAPTLVELAGLRPLLTFQGRSFAPILENPDATVRRHVFAERHWHDYTAHQRAVRSGRYLYIWNAYPDLPDTPPADAVRSPTYRAMLELLEKNGLNSRQFDCFVRPRPIEELYDLENDPHALDDIIGRPAARQVHGEMRRALADFQRTTGDTVGEERRPDEFHRETGERLRQPGKG